jgi:CheY-like chemotaxis protein
MSRERNRVLLVEDETIVALVEDHILREHGYVVRRAATGEEAVAMFAENDGYDIVLMDIDLGTGINGVEAARKILGERVAPLIILSSCLPEEIDELASGIGRYGCEQKDDGTIPPG